TGRSRCACRRGGRAVASAGRRPDAADGLPDLERAAALRRHAPGAPTATAGGGGTVDQHQLGRSHLLRRLRRRQLPGGTAASRLRRRGAAAVRGELVPDLVPRPTAARAVARRTRPGLNTRIEL